MSGDNAQHAEDGAWSAAEQWFCRLEAEDCTPADRMAFARWLEASPAHRRAWDDTVALFDASLGPARTVAGWPGPSSPRRQLWWRPARRVAVAAALLVVAGLFLFQSGDWGADLATGTGERRSLTLADGSVVELDADSAVDLAVAADGVGDRRVRLRHGRAYFQVVADPARPFVVATAHGQVRVVGTRFAVAADTRLEVAVEQGAVDVSGADHAPLRLGPGQRGVVRGGRAEAAGTVDLMAELAWRRGQLVVRQQPLADLAADLDRYWPGRLVVVGGELTARRVSGVIDLDRRDAGLAALSQMLGARVLHLTPALTVLY